MNLKSISKNNHASADRKYLSPNNFLQLISGSKFKPLPCYGSYFQLLDYSKITKEKDTEYAIRLTREAGVASIPVSVFYNVPVDNKVLRFCFAKDDATLEKAAEKLRAVK